MDETAGKVNSEMQSFTASGKITQQMYEGSVKFDNLDSFTPLASHIQQPVSVAQQKDSQQGERASLADTNMNEQDITCH